MSPREYRRPDVYGPGDGWVVLLCCFIVACAVFMFLGCFLGRCYGG